METVGFIGLGNMGGGMSANIQRAGYPMIVYDLREEAALPLLEGGARLANTPAEVAAASDVTFTSLPGPYEVEAVSTGAEGVLEGIRPGSVYIAFPPAGPRSSERSSRSSGPRAATYWTLRSAAARRARHRATWRLWWAETARCSTG